MEQETRPAIPKFRFINKVINILSNSFCLEQVPGENKYRVKKESGNEIGFIIVPGPNGTVTNIYIIIEGVKTSKKKAASEFIGVVIKTFGCLSLTAPTGLLEYINSGHTDPVGTKIYNGVYEYHLQPEWQLNIKTLYEYKK